MLADPQSVTVATVAKTLPAIDRGRFTSTYREAGGEHELIISTNFAKRDRSVIRLNHTKTASDPLTAETVNVSASVYMVIDRSKFGYSDSELDDLVQALCDYSVTATVEKVVAGES